MESLRGLRVVHFNDVYDVFEGAQEPVGGAARFLSAVKRVNSLVPGPFGGVEPLVLFSGDLFSPSILANAFRGAHMLRVLREAGVACATPGNHDFDFGSAQLAALVRESGVPWVCANLKARETGLPLAGTRETCLLRHQGLCIGVVGLAEREWISTLPLVEPADVRVRPPSSPAAPPPLTRRSLPPQVDYEDFVGAGTRCARSLREAGADVVLALTHMRLPNDERLARESEGIDLILGGHDHLYAVREIARARGPSCAVVKSGTDFRQLSVVDVLLPRPCHASGPSGPGDAAGQGSVPAFVSSQGTVAGGELTARVWRVDITRAVPPDGPAARWVEGLEDEVRARLEQAVGETRVPLDGRFAALRAGETNLGNWCADAMRASLRADAALLNGGTLRADAVLPAGRLARRDIAGLVPRDHPLVLLRIRGGDLLDALENGVSHHPRLEGRFPQVSGIAFAFDPGAPPMRRVLRGSVTVAGRALDLERCERTRGGGGAGPWRARAREPESHTRAPLPLTPSPPPPPTLCARVQALPAGHQGLSRAGAGRVRSPGAGRGCGRRRRRAHDESGAGAGVGTPGRGAAHGPERRPRPHAARRDPRRIAGAGADRACSGGPGKGDVATWRRDNEKTLESVVVIHCPKHTDLPYFLEFLPHGRWRGTWHGCWRGNGRYVAPSAARTALGATGGGGAR